MPLSLCFVAFARLSLFLMYLFVLRLRADEPSRMALNRGFRLGIEAAIIAVHISTVVLFEDQIQLGSNSGGVWKTLLPWCGVWYLYPALTRLLYLYCPRGNLHGTHSWKETSF